MKMLLDTNVLLRTLQADHPMNPVAEKALDVLASAGHQMCIVPQNLYEVWVAMTRPESANGLGLSAPEAADVVNQTRRLFPLLDDTPLILPEWERFVLTYSVLGKTAHDARLVAAMTVHGVSHLLTFNDADFRRYEEIRVLHPTQVTPPGV